MAQKAPGKHHREGITFVELFRMFPDDEAAQTWVEGIRWPDGPYCPHFQQLISALKCHLRPQLILLWPNGGHTTFLEPLPVL